MAGGSRLDQPGRASTGEVQGRRLWVKPFARRPSYVKPAKTAGRARTTSRRSVSAGAGKRAGRAVPRRAKRPSCNPHPPSPPATGQKPGGAGLRYPAPDEGRRSTDNVAAVARPLASAQPERKPPPRAGLKYWDERAQRVVEL